MPAPLFDTYAPPPLELESGQGAELTAKDGRNYLDFISGIAVNALGHGHPALVEALKSQADKLWHLSNMFRIPGQRELADLYCAHTFADRVFFTNSGAEAVECALKTARRYHYANGAPDRIKIVTFTGAFHGRTMGAINAGGNPKYLEGFGPAMEGFQQIPFGDHDALKAAVDDKTAAVLVEPVQGEGGVRAIPEGCLTGLRALCDEKGALLIYDEVQCGAGRTGRLFAHQWARDAEPDIMAVAKGVGGGFPMGACLATEKAGAPMVIGTHGSTFGGNPLAMAVGLAAFGELVKPELMQHVNDVANVLTQQLHRVKDAHPDLVEEVRGKGLLVGLKLSIDPKPVQGTLRDMGLLVGSAGDNVLRMAPPLIISADQARKAADLIDGALAKHEVA